MISIDVISIEPIAHSTVLHLFFSMIHVICHPIYIDFEENPDNGQADIK